MKKRILCIALAAVMLLSLSMGAFAAQSSISVTIDGSEVEFTADSGVPFVDENGRTQVPLRAVMEQYGCDVEWDSASNAAVITKGSDKVIVPIGKSWILVNSRTVAMDTAALVQNGRTYLPIRPVLEAFGANVEWDNGKVSVSSPANGAFENIYVDKNGDLIFELSNGNKINAGSVSGGRDGRDGTDGRDGVDGSDGVSVVDAYVDNSGNLIIALSSGRTINAGNIGAGGSMSGLTFADYSVGTRFYLTQPAGEFSVYIDVSNSAYTVVFSDVYYELTAKRDYTDRDAWLSEDGAARFLPYEVTMHITGYTDSALAGKELTVSFSDAGYGSWYYEADIAGDGSFEMDFVQGSDGKSIWYAPKTLILNRVTIEKNSSDPDPKPNPGGTDIPEDILEMIKACAGEWAAAPKAVITLKEDGTLIYKGVEYMPEYYGSGDQLIAYVGEEGLQFIFSISDGEMLAADSATMYYKGRTWETVTLTADNWLDYYELTITTEFVNDAFGEYDYVNISTCYTLKEEYAARLDGSLKSAVDVKYSCDRSRSKYTVDVPAQTVSWSQAEGSVYTDDNIVSATFLGVRSLWLSGNYLSGTSGEAYFYSNTQVVNAQGTLYLINN